MRKRYPICWTSQNRRASSVLATKQRSFICNPDEDKQRRQAFKSGGSNNKSHEQRERQSCCSTFTCDKHKLISVTLFLESKAIIWIKIGATLSLGAETSF